MTNVEQFDKAAASVIDVRGKDYGHPADTFGRIARMQAELRDLPDIAVRHALEMICVKMARLVQTPDHLDSVIDIAGYARTIAMVLDRRVSDEQPVRIPDNEIIVEFLWTCATCDAIASMPIGKSPVPFCHSLRKCEWTLVTP